jgi:tRNA threonylcarbamoyladenosine biosynthesis protein TsaB
MLHPRMLILETSHAPGFVALAQGAQVLAVRQLDEARRHARDLAPAVAALLAQLQWKPRDIAAVAVSIGPGSYTGLRIGIMSAKAFCYATGCSLVAIETFGAIAAQAPADLQRLAVLADAQQKLVYVQEFNWHNATPEAKTPLAIAEFATWARAAELPMGVSGPGLLRWRSQLPPAMQVVDEQLWLPTAETLAANAAERAARCEWSDYWSIEPIYLRPSAAEEQWNRKK